MPEPAALSADAVRMRAVAQARRRREAVRAAMEAAAELVAVAEKLRRSVRPTRFERQWMARQWIGLGYLSARQVADRLGVSERTVWRYLGHP